MRPICIFLLIPLFCWYPSTGQIHLELLSEGYKNYHEIVSIADAFFKNQGKVRGYKQYMRWKEFWGPRVMADGQFVPVVERNMQAYTRFADQMSDVDRATHGYWSFLGPTSYSLGAEDSGGMGRINCIAFHPNDADIIYVGAASGGVWKTSDGGNSWTHMTDGMSNLGISGIAISHISPNTVYILTGDGDGTDTFSSGVMVSYNGGNTWWETDDLWQPSDLVRAYKLIMHPVDDQILLVASSDGIYRTIDGGDNWFRESTGSYTDIEFKPGDPTTLYAVDNQFVRSGNTGDTWAPTAVSDLPADDFSRIAVAVTPDDPDVVYLLYGGGSMGFRGLYRSTNGGDDFFLRSNSPNIMGKDLLGGGTDHQASYDIALAVDPGDYTRVFVGGIRIWRSQNGGIGWVPVTYGPEDTEPTHFTHADIHALEYNGNTLFTGTDGGFFKTADAGSSWTNLSMGLAVMQFYKIDVEGGILIGGTQDNGTSQWSVPATVAERTRGSDGFVGMIDFTDTDTRYASTQNTKYRSTDAGASWSNITPDGLSDFWNSDWIMHHSVPDTQFLGHGDVYRTTTGGTGNDPWIDLNAFNSESPKIRALALGVSNDDRLYAAKRNQIKVSSNVNAANPSWTDITSGLPVGVVEIKDVALDPDNSARLWVVFGGYSNGEKVFFSFNSGSTWTNVSLNLPNVPVNCITYQNGSNDGIYIGTDIGVFYKSISTGNWIYYGNGLPNMPVFDLVIDGNQLYAGTYGRGIWKSFLYSTCALNYTLTSGNDPSDGNFTGVQAYHASNSITSTRTIKGGTGTDVLYASEGFVELLPGFRAYRGNFFKAAIEGCPD